MTPLYVHFWMPKTKHFVFVDRSVDRYYMAIILDRCAVTWEWGEIRENRMMLSVDGIQGYKLSLILPTSCPSYIRSNVAEHTRHQGDGERLGYANKQAMKPGPPRQSFHQRLTVIVLDKKCVILCGLYTATNQAILCTVNFSCVGHPPLVVYSGWKNWSSSLRNYNWYGENWRCGTDLPALARPVSVTLAQLCINVGPASAMLAQHRGTAGPTSPLIAGTGKIIQ